MSRGQNVDRILDKLEKAGYRGVASQSDYAVSYAIKHDEITILTPSCGNLNFNINHWPALKKEIDLIVKEIRGF